MPEPPLHLFPRMVPTLLPTRWTYFIKATFWNCNEFYNSCYTLYEIPRFKGHKGSVGFQSYSKSFEHPGDVGPRDTPGVSMCTKSTRGIDTESDRNKNLFLATHQNFQRTVAASAATPPARWGRPRHPSPQGSAPTARTPEMLPRGAGVQALSAFISAHLRADADLQSINWHPRSLYWPARPVLTTHSPSLHFITPQITDASLHRNIMFALKLSTGVKLR